jgi:hypothetical protein
MGNVFIYRYGENDEVWFEFDQEFKISNVIKLITQNLVWKGRRKLS